MSKVVNIQLQSITAIEDKSYWIKVLAEAPAELVKHRELRKKYHTNRDIKYWSTYFLLKAVSPQSSKIERWIKQKSFLLAFLQMNENTFRRNVKYLVSIGLATVDENYSISLASYEKAADLLDLENSVTKLIPYNPIKNGGKQVFQYLVRAEEFRYQQRRQLDALIYHLNKNPSLKNTVHLLMVKAGADDQRLYKEVRYFQESLLQLQMKLFKEGSEILEYVLTHRADINRGVSRIQDHHAYKAKQSCSYLKKRMFKLGVIKIEKVCVESTARSRLYIPLGETKRDGYKWVPAVKRTAWFLTDQISICYEASPEKRAEKKAEKAA
jgi:hypothetical protein